MQKTIYSLGALRECMTASNRRYLEFISELVDPSAGVCDVERLSEPVRVQDRSVGGFNLFCRADLEVVVGLVCGGGVIGGVSNRLLRGVLSGNKSSAQVSLVLRRLRLHGLIKKVAHSYRYYLTSFGRRVLLTGLKLRELVVIPSLAGVLP